ncbi:DUF4388 domain-containing protein, partial [bacterium]|nr:DUF4388 domain-containing protein [bacterium]
IDNPTTFTDFRTPSKFASNSKRALPPSGDLADVKLSRLLRLLTLNSRTGVLSLGEGEKQLSLHFDHGRLVFIDSGFIEGYALADVIREENIVSPEYLPALRRRMLDENRLLGHLLLQVGVIKQHDLERALKLQIVRKAVWPFTWREGPYTFSKEQPRRPSDLTINVKMGDLIFRGVRESSDADAFYKEVGDPRTIRVRMQQGRGFDLKDLELTREESDFVKHLSGNRSLAEIIDESRLDEEHALSVLLGLFSLRLAKRVK